MGRCWPVILMSLARYPHVESMIGQNFLNAPLFQNVLSKTNQGTLRLTSPVDGKDRLGSARLLNDFPIAVIATTTVSAALADLRGKNKFIIAAGGLSLFV